MYTRESKLISSIEALNNYIDGFDVYNSELLQLMKSNDLAKKEYEIKTFEYRPDLIAKDFYGSTKYIGILMIQCALPLSGYTRGTILKLIPKAALDNLIKSM